jgi:hypothetical protein
MANNVEILITAKDQATATINKTTGGLKGLSDGFQSMTGVSLGAAGALTAVASMLKYSIGQAKEAEKVMAATEAVIKSTGGAAGMTASQIADLADAESRLTSIDDAVIQNGENMLLTFTNIGSTVFPQATRAMEDMAVAMAKGDTANIDLNNTAIQLGKALNDPIAGITALQRVGVTFNATQKEMIADFVKSNDIAGAQGVILKELNKEFGGMADAMGGTASGKMQIAKNNIDNLSESLGGKLLPVLGDAAGAFNDLLTGIDRINATFEEHNTVVAKSATTYQEYQAEMIRAAVASQQLYGLTGLTAEQILASADYTKKASDQMGIYSQDLFEASRLVDSWAVSWKTAGGAATNAANETNTAVTDVQTALDSLNSMNTNLSSAIAGQLDKQAFADSGGAAVQAYVDEVNKAFAEGQISDEDWKKLMDKAYVASQQVDVAMGTISGTEAAENISSTLGKSLEEANKLALDTGSNINAIKSKDVVIRVTTYYKSIYGAEGTPGQGGGGDAFGGSAHVGPAAFGKTFKIPAAFGFEGFPTPMGTASGGERVTVTPEGQNQEMDLSEKTIRRMLLMMRDVKLTSL